MPGARRQTTVVIMFTGYYAADTIASVIYKQYQAGFYGLSTAGNVVLFVLIAVLVVSVREVQHTSRGSVELRRGDETPLSKECSQLILFGHDRLRW